LNRETDFPIVQQGFSFAAWIRHARASLTQRLAVRSRVIERKLKGVEELPTGDALKVLSFEDGIDSEAEGDDELGE
jgi:hypothetical protein